MIRSIRKLLFILRVSWAVVTGRWFYLRNEPYWLVKLMADTIPDDTHREEIHEMHDYAKKEIAMRERKGDKQDYGFN